MISGERGEEIQRCDSCGQLPDDDSAAVMHAVECKRKQCRAHLADTAADLLAAALAVMRAREDGTFGADGYQGFKLLEQAINNARSWK